MGCLQICVRRAGPLGLLLSALFLPLQAQASDPFPWREPSDREILNASAAAQVHEHSSAPATPETSYPSLNLIGFMDINFFANDDQTATVRSGFSEGQFVLHFTSALSSRLSFFGELSLTARRDALTSSTAVGFNPEVERAILKFSVNDFLKLSAGRYHTPLNYWNVAFHHGQWLQTTISRPEMIQFGGQFLPVHFVGLLVEGSAPVAKGSLNYNLGLGNGRASVISRGGDASDVNNNRAWILGLGFQPDAFYALKLGGAVYGDKVTLASSSHRELIASGFIAWTKETPELLAEYAQVRHRDLGNDRVSTNFGYYALVAYRLPVFERRWKPYFRWEKIKIDAADPVFSALGSREGFLAGLRYDFADLAAVKVEYRRQRKPDTPYVNAFFAQISFTF